MCGAALFSALRMSKFAFQSFWLLRSHTGAPGPAGSGMASSAVPAPAAACGAAKQGFIRIRANKITLPGCHLKNKFTHVQQVSPQFLFFDFPAKIHFIISKIYICHSNGLSFFTLKVPLPGPVKVYFSQSSSWLSIWRCLNIRSWTASPAGLPANKI